MTPDRREVLADDVRRLAGLAEAAVVEAGAIGVEAPEDVARCVVCWRHWAWQITGDGDDDAWTGPGLAAGGPAGGGGRPRDPAGAILDVTLYTASYATADPDRGVPIQTSIGAPWFVGYPVVKWATVAPWGLLDKDLDEASFRRAYRARLHRLTPKILDELAELRAAYAPLPLLLCCWEDLSKPGVWCHRTMLGSWLSERLGEEIHELTRGGTT